MTVSLNLISVPLILLIILFSNYYATLTLSLLVVFVGAGAVQNRSPYSGPSCQQ